LDLALRTTRAGGRIVLAGLPVAGADLTPLWYRELELAGAYTSGVEDVNGEHRHTFDLALDLVREAPLEGLVEDVYPLPRWREAVDHALDAGRLGTFKVAFDPRRG
jgi:threonine dehydrogenase-like Zn-dependent dehydrogenase